jgi:hypothetical protein
MRAAFRVLIVACVLSAMPALTAPLAVAQDQGTAPEIKVLSTGKAPREQLRLSPPVGSTQTAAMMFRQSIKQSGVSSGSVNVPPIRATLAATLPDTTPNGDLHVTFSYPSFEVLKGNGSTAAARRAVADALEGFQGLSGEMTVTTEGAVVDSSLAIPPGIDPSIADVLGQFRDQQRSLTAPLPEPAVGQGARWRVTTELTLRGIRVRQVYEYTLKKREGTRLELDVRGSQTAQPQSVGIPGQPAGVKIRVTKLNTKLRGAITYDLSQVMTTSGRIAGRGDQEFRVEAGSQKGTLRQHIDLEAAIKPA